MVRTVHKHVTTRVTVVTTLMVSVIEDVNRAGRETTVNNVMSLHNTIILSFVNLKAEAMALLMVEYYI